MADSAFRKRPKTSGHDDMVMLSKAGNQEIHDNLNMRYKNDIIYTYIGEVLIAVNPFKSIPIYNDSKIDEYNGVQMSENPPHIYAIGDDMYRNLLIDHEDQCVIISGESGAGKTVNAKFIMEYLSKVSGGIGDIERVKKIIMSTNPLLEAFGNAKTLRNNNSSRFGKYFTINFDQGGQPVGGSISNFLLEKTRVSGIQPGERNFHIFYMLISGLKNKGVASDFGLGSGAESFRYTSMSGEYHADGIDDVSEFLEMEQALKIINLSQEKINQIYSILSGVLYLGNIEFQENSSGWAEIVDNGAIENAASLLNVDSASLSKCLLTCKVRMVNEVISKTFNAFQANQARDSLAQGIYTRMFDNFVLQINDTLKVPNVSTKSCGVLDIYGFEIFDNNGFEQLCINFVNEKLQQIFIELTLKSEQEEYKREQIQWTDIKYLNNKEICDVIEMKLPKPGIFYLMNDVSKSANAMDPGKVDKQILGIIVKNLTGRIIGAAGEGAFTIQHYAGQVTYNVSGFFEKNRDVLYEDMITSMQSSTSAFLSNLFDNERDNSIAHPAKGGRKPKIDCAGMIIKKQANDLVTELTKTRPHYVRCMKPNETKRAGDWDPKRVIHQVKYLGLSENVRVRRAGFAYRRSFDKFLQRYNILQYIDNLENASAPASYDSNPQLGKASIQKIMDSCGMGPSGDDWQYGKTKLFIKAPESVGILEDKREWLYDRFARTVQKHLRVWLNRAKAQKVKEDSSEVVFGKKARSRPSLNRRYFGDYVGLDQNPEYRGFCNKRENVLFAAHLKKYDAKMNPCRRTLILTPKRVLLLGYETVKTEKQKTADQNVELVCKWKIDIPDLQRVHVSTMQDGFFMIQDTWHGEKDPARADLLFKTEYLTEFLYLLSKKTIGYRSDLNFVDEWVMMTPKPKGFLSRFKKLPRDLVFKQLANSNKHEAEVRKVAKYKYEIQVPQGLPKNTKPKIVENAGNTGFSQNVDLGSQNRADDLYTLPTDHCQISKKSEESPYLPPIPTNRSLLRTNTYKPNSEENAKKASKRWQESSNVINQAMMGGLVKQLETQSESVEKKKSPPPPRPRTKPVTNLKKCRAVWDYDPVDQGELKLRVGDIIVIKHDGEEDGWWEGTLNGETGLFPGNFVEKI